jgi:hypothetical protein
MPVGGNGPVNRALKCDIGAFVVVWFVLMLHWGNEAYASVAWDNVFLHCLGTVVLTALVSAVMVGMLWCVYWMFKRMAGGWGRVLVIPWIGISVWIYPNAFNQGWPDTNPDPEGTAAFFATFEGAGILLLGIGLCSFLRRRFGSHQT